VSDEERTTLAAVLCFALGAVILAMLFTGSAGCAGWQRGATATVLSVEAAAKTAHRDVLKPACVDRGDDLLRVCLEQSDRVCAPLARCDAAFTVLRATVAAVHAAKLAIKAGNKGLAEGSVSAVLRQAEQLERAIEVIR
jgi:hypothetical protein